jgi:hypothetical protein
VMMRTMIQLIPTTMNIFSQCKTILLRIDVLFSSCIYLSMYYIFICTYYVIMVVDLKW